MMRAFRSVPNTGVIYVMNKAKEHGILQDRVNWCNFGQGQPETGNIAGISWPEPSLSKIYQTYPQKDPWEYAPTNGVWELREAIAQFYNTKYRKSQKSQYSAENICITPGGRSGLTRVIAAMHRVNLGHFLPDYTAYEELLEIFKNINPIPLLLNPENKYHISIDELKREILGKGLGSLLFSNPCNPVGKVVDNENLEAWSDLARENECAFISDEFYSGYIWNGNGPKMVSMAQTVKNVETDPVIILDGLTKNWRFPGARISWIVAPKKLIDIFSSSGSFLDGGANHPLQLWAKELLGDCKLIDQNHQKLYHHFLQKRNSMINSLKGSPFLLDSDCEGTFYLWVKLPENCDSMDFFNKALKEQVVVVPGPFFDVNPGKRRFKGKSRFGNYLRLSFGPPLKEIELGISRLKKII